MGFKDRGRTGFSGERSEGFGRREGSFGGKRGGFGGNRGGFGGRSGGFGGRGSSDGPRTMHSATCSKCGKECQVPFRPTGAKPVLCSDCFRQSGNGNDSGPSRNFAPRSFDRAPAAAAAGISPEQFKQLNAKLDKIIEMLEGLEIVEGDDLEDNETEEE